MPEAILLPPPAPEAAAGEFLLGTLCYGHRTLRPLRLRRENFIKHISIFSITGGGKTNVAQLLVLGLLNKDTPFLVVDWERSYHALRGMLLQKAKQIVVYSVGRKGRTPLHWNPLRGPLNVPPKIWIRIVAEALEKSHLSGPSGADILIGTLARNLTSSGSTTKRWGSLLTSSTRPKSLTGCGSAASRMTHLWELSRT